MKDYENIYQLYQDALSTAAQYKPIWDKISNYVSIGVQPNYVWNSNESKSQQLDQYVNDPTSAISVNQGGDYMLGIMWGTGDSACTVMPSRYVKELVDPATLKDFYNFATDQLLYHMNHADAGLNNSMRPYAYDQFGFGTSGIGCFPNQDFKNCVSENALLFRSYGVDNMVIDEGKSGAIDTVFAIYNWRTMRIVSEFCTRKGQIDEKMIKQIMPKEVQDAYFNDNYNQVFSIVCGVFPRSDYSPKLKGKRGTQYRGVWFMNGGKEGKFFYEEDFRKKPISVARQIKVRGEIWGRSSGTMLLSSISGVDFMVGESFDIIEKMSKPSLGVFGNAIFGDSALDTSADGLTVFNGAFSGKSPVFPLMEVGDPSKLIQYLIPYLDNKITTAFKIDALLDFNSAKDMTATESLQRYAIRGKSLAGMLMQQKSELLVPLCSRGLSVLMDLGELGVDPKADPERAKQLMNNGLAGRVIPDAVLECMAKGLPWYELRFKNELEKLTRTENIQALTQVIQATIAISQVYPDIIHAIDWYKLLSEINDNLDTDAQIMLTDKQFKDEVAKAAQARNAAMQGQATQANADAAKSLSEANKNNATAKSTQAGI